MKPLSSYYEDENRKWTWSNASRVVTFQQMTSSFSDGYLRPVTMRTAINGLRKTAVCPVDMNVFSEADFSPFATTDLEKASVTNSGQNVSRGNTVENIDPQEGTSQNTDMTFQFSNLATQKIFC